MRVRPWSDASDTGAMQRLASRRWPCGPHPGGVGWAVASDQMAPRIALAEDEGPVGWAGVGAAGELALQAAPGRADVARALVDWALGACDGASLQATVWHGDDTAAAALAWAGFSPDAAARPVYGMLRAAAGVSPALPPGYRVRSVAEGELADRVEVHRRAWRPFDLPWAEAARPPVSLDATSRFTAEHYARVRTTWLYDAALDLVVEAPDGSLAACCIVWWDPAIGCAEIEPLGVVPRHRRRGLAAALCQEACTRVAERGGKQVFINTGPRDDYPAPAATYASVGFAAVARGVVHRLTR